MTNRVNSNGAEQNPLRTKDDLKSPAFILFAAIYGFAVATAFLSDPMQALVYIGMSLGILLLIWLILALTKKYPAVDIQVKQPWIDLACGCLLYLIFTIAPDLDFGGQWALGDILQRVGLLFALPLVFLRLRGNTFSSMGLSLSNWTQNLKVGGIVLACMAVPCVFLVGDAAKIVLGGQVSLLQALLAILVYFIHNVVMVGLPEEFFFRGFLQPRLSQVLGSKLGGILIVSLLFGLAHISPVMRGTELFETFCSTFLAQGCVGLIFGFIWERARNLIPGVLVHSGVNALNNVGTAVSMLFQ